MEKRVAFGFYRVNNWPSSLKTYHLRGNVKTMYVSEKIHKVCKDHIQNFTFNEDGYLIYYRAYGDNLYTHEKSYNYNNDQLVSIVERCENSSTKYYDFHFDGKILISKIRYKNNIYQSFEKIGSVIILKEYDQDGKLEWRTELDENYELYGNITIEDLKKQGDQFDMYDNIIYSVSTNIRFVYQYDEFGNWVDRKAYKNNILSSHVVKKIIYY